MQPDPLLRPLEDLLNRNIAGSARARGLLARVEGRALAVRVQATPFRVACAAKDGRLLLGSGDEGADVVIEGTPLSLARMAASDATASLRGRSVRIEGDAEVAEGFRDLLAAARPDLEEELSRVTGDAAAHHIARAARTALDFARKVLDTATRNTAEYLTEESRDLPTRTEAEEFLAAVDALREDTDRLAARLAALERGAAR